VRKQAAELIDRFLRIKADQARVLANPGARVQAARPVRQIVVLEPLEQLTPDARRRRDLIQRQSAPLAVQPDPETKKSLGAGSCIEPGGGV
jgi:hypothetical protein